MKRVPEPEVMSGADQSTAYAEADFQAVNSGFLLDMLAHFPDMNDGIAVDLGCGPADICLRLAQARPALAVHGIDASAAMLRHGQGRIDAAGLEQHVTLHRQFLPLRDGHGVPQADTLISNSLLHHLADPQTLWLTLAQLGHAGARVYVMDLTRPRDRIDAQAIVDRHARDEPEILRHDFFHSLCAAYRVDEVRRQLDAAGLHRLSVRMVSDRHLVISGRLPGN